MHDRYYFRSKQFLDSYHALSPTGQSIVDKAIEKHKQGGYENSLQSKRLDGTEWKRIKPDGDLRLIFRRIGYVDIFVYVDHHDKAYKWARRHTLQESCLLTVDEKHEQREVVHTIRIEKPLLFAHCSAEYLLSVGVPAQLLDGLRNCCTSETFTEYIDKLDPEVWEKLNCIREGKPVVESNQPNGCQVSLCFTDSDTRKALEEAFPKWIIYLHPKQQDFAYKTYPGPARIAGGAGTGKSVVLIHRASHLASRLTCPRVLVTAYNKHTAAKLAADLDLFLHTQPDVRSRIEVRNIHKIARKIGEEILNGKNFRLINDLPGRIKNALSNSPESANLPEFCTPEFLAREWTEVIEDCGIETFDAYRKADRTGRRFSLTASQKQKIWHIFASVRSNIRMCQVTFGGLLKQCTSFLRTEKQKPYDHVLVDEAQLLGTLELRFLRSLVSEGANDLFFALDENQRLYRPQRNWKEAGVIIANRSDRLDLTYRSTGQIIKFASHFVQRQIGAEIAEDSVSSYLSGPEPELYSADSVEQEISKISAILSRLWRSGFQPREIAIFAQEEEFLRNRAEPAAAKAGMRSRLASMSDTCNATSLLTMQLSVGLEFRAVIVIGCEADVINAPLQFDQDLDPDELAKRRMSALYVACTRARERLFLTSAGRMHQSVIEAANESGIEIQRDTASTQFQDGFGAAATA